MLLLLLAPLPGSLFLHAQTLTWFGVPETTLIQRLSAVPLTNEERGMGLEALFRDAGCPAEMLQRGRVNKSWNNIICTLQGSTEEVIVVGAHYDRGPRGEGAVDNWTGTSLLASLFQAFAGEKRRFTYMFVGFAEEEKGLVGSRAFVKGLDKESLAKVKAMVNIDSVGLSAPKVWHSRSDKQLLTMIARAAAATKIPVAGMNVDNVGDSDSRPFADKKVPVLDVHSLTSETFPILHSEKDKLSAVVLKHYLEAFRLLVATLAYLDGEFQP